MDRRELLRVTCGLFGASVAGCVESGSSSSEQRGLVIANHSRIDDRYCDKVEFVVRNERDEESFAKVKITLYNPEGQLLDTRWHNQWDIPPGKEWTSVARICVPGEKVDSYEIEVSDE